MRNLWEQPHGRATAQCPLCTRYVTPAHLPKHVGDVWCKVEQTKIEMSARGWVKVGGMHVVVRKSGAPLEDAPGFAAMNYDPDTRKTTPYITNVLWAPRWVMRIARVTGLSVQTRATAIVLLGILDHEVYDPWLESTERLGGKSAVAQAVGDEVNAIMKEILDHRMRAERKGKR